MLAVRILIGLLIAYLVLLGLAWAFQDRLAFPAPREAPPDPAQVRPLRVEQLTLVMHDHTPLVAWYFHPAAPAPRPSTMLWFYGNGEPIAALWPVIRDFQPPGTAVLVVDYPGYGASGGRTTETGLYEAADSAYAWLASHGGEGARRLFVYGRSLGTAVATYVAATHPVAGLILESPFTSAREMVHRHYTLFPSFVLRLRLDNLGTITRVHCPVLVFHGTADRLVPPDMGRRVAQAAPHGAELVLIEGARHNETYDAGGRRYRDKLFEFVTQH